MFHPPNPQKWTDNHLVLLDSFERMSGYAYFGIVDHDEFIIPSKGRTLKQLLVRKLMKTSFLAILFNHGRGCTDAAYRATFQYSYSVLSCSVSNLSPFQEKLLHLFPCPAVAEL